MFGLLKLAATIGFSLFQTPVAQAGDKPNIVIILADDLGYGDVACFNRASKIPTPHLDRLAQEGMKFTDAHAAGAVCIPSRYGLLTGRYPFRHRRNPKQGVVIEPGRMTLASQLKQSGYTTAMIGKWHLGFEGGDHFDYTKPLRGGPVDRGFDSFFGIHASTDIPPYFYIQNDRVVEAPTQRMEAGHTPGWSPIQGAFWREGAIAPTLKLAEVMPAFTSNAVAWIQNYGTGKATPPPPFFLYVAFTGPHTPWLPSREFQGRSKLGLYGDWVVQVDASVGKILQALDQSGRRKDTLIFFTSDNGPTWYPEDVQRLGHSSSGPWRGMKGDAWEGGHRLPLVARWPGKIKPGTETSRTICFTDFMATLAALTKSQLPEGAGEDSFSFLPTLLGKKPVQPPREAMVVVSSQRWLTIRQGEWKLINGLGSGGFSKVKADMEKTPEAKGQLYNLAQDPGEERNLWREKPEIVQRLTALLAKVTSADRHHQFEIIDE